MVQIFHEFLPIEGFLLLGLQLVVGSFVHIVVNFVELLDNGLSDSFLRELELLSAASDGKSHFVLLDILRTCKENKHTYQHFCFF